jgi:translation initiation factor 2 subunit 2
MEYEKLLEQAYKKIKPIKSKKERFEIPEIDAKIEGYKTIISNFLQICNFIGRKPEHFKKFLEKGLASGSKIQGNRLILQRKILTKEVNTRFKEYLERFVICKECKKPDTELIKEHHFNFLHCLACGAKHPIPKI